MRLRLGLVLVVLAACGPIVGRDPNGFWKGADAGMYFYDWDGGSYWDGKNIYLLDQLNISLEQDCSKVSFEGGRVRLTSADRPTQSVQMLGTELRLRVDSTGTWVDEAYRFHRRDAGFVGSVQLSFDAGFHLKVMIAPPFAGKRTTATT